jgi:hypothetical protein
VILPVLFIGAAPRAYAQGIFTGTISGTVQDASGAVVPNATISATNVATGVTLKGIADATGNFKLASVPVGTYSITVQATGFEAKKIANVAVNAGKDAGLGSEQLKVGQAAETVEVTESENILETTQAQVTSTFDTQAMQNLPTGGGLDAVVLLIPGVASARSNRFGNTNGAAIASNGQRERSDNFEIDGQSNNDNSVTGPQFFFSNADAVQEVEVITNQMSAQYGRDAGAVVNYVLKSGTNQWHGTAFEQYAGSFLSSLTQAQKQGGLTRAPRFVYNYFGGTLGLPIIKDKLFGYAGVYFQHSYSGANVSLSGSPTATTGYLPTPNGMKALQVLYPNNPGVQALAGLFPYNVGQGTVTALAGTTPKHILNQITDGTTVMPDLEVQKYQRAYNPYSTDEELLGRVDYVMSNKDRFYLRYMYQTNPSYFAAGTVSTGGYVNVYAITHSVGATWTHYFTQQLANDLRWSFQQSAILFQGGGFPNCTTKNFTTCPTSLGMTTSTSVRLTPSDGTSAIALGSTGLSTSYPQGRTVKTNQAQDNLTWTHGKQSIYFGGSYEFQNSPNVFLPNISGGYTLNGWNGLMQGTGTLGLAVGNPTIPFTEPDASAYFQDDWKVTPNLTLNLGVRWEFFAQSINLLHNISVANQTGSSPLWSTSLPLSQTTFPYVPQYYRNIQPRIGFAYNPDAIKGLVIRGGYALNGQPAYYNIFLNSYGSAPVVLSSTISGCSNTAKPCVPSGGANYSTVHALNNKYLPTGGNPGSFSQTLVNSSFRPTRVQSYNLGFQYAINSFLVGEARYVGVHTSAEYQSLNGNPAIGTAAKQFPQFFGTATYCTDSTQIGYNSGNGRTSCAAGNIRLRANTSFIVYHGLQTSLRTRNYHGVTADVSWTWSRAIDNASEIFGNLGGSTNTGPPFAQNPLDTNVGERGRSNNSFPNVTSIGFTWVEPWFNKGNNLQAKLLGGYQFNTIYTFQSGAIYTPFQLLEGSYCDGSFAAAFNSSVDTCRPILANPSAPLGTVGVNLGNGAYVDVATGNSVPRSSVHWLLNNTAEAKAMGNPYPGVSRNTLKGMTWNNPDVSIYKSTKLTERLNMQLQLLVYNPLNRAYYGVPDAQVEDAGATFGNFSGNNGSAFGVGTGTRNVQLGGKFIF